MYARHTPYAGPDICRLKNSSNVTRVPNAVLVLFLRPALAVFSSVRSFVLPFLPSLPSCRNPTRGTPRASVLGPIKTHTQSHQHPPALQPLHQRYHGTNTRRRGNHCTNNHGKHHGINTASTRRGGGRGGFRSRLRTRPSHKKRSTTRILSTFFP